jgi:serine/threonine-protein kinase
MPLNNKLLPIGARMSDVFVSYKAEDRARVCLLVEALEADGLSVWWDAHISGGDEWRDSIQQHLDESKCVIVVWSKRSIGPEGHFVRDEATRAQRRHAYLPVRIDKVDPPLGFGETQAIPIIRWKGDRSDPQYQAVLAAARAIVSGVPRPHYAPLEPAGFSRRAVFMSATGAIAAAAVGAWFLLKPMGGKSNSIAVLPFANLSGDPAQAYFSDGMAEELRSALSRIAGLKVVARTSSEILRDADAKTAAQKLGVANILTGSVRKSSSMIRVSAQLIDGGNGMERWSETFDRPVGDVLKIQTGIAESVAYALSIKLAGDGRAVLEAGGTRIPEAQDLYLRAVAAEIDDDTEKGTTKALSLLDSAIELDPNYADAHARKALVLALWTGVYAHSVAESLQKFEEALASANRAIAIAPHLAAGYAARGLVYRQQLNFGPALADFRKAVSLSSNDAETLRGYALQLGTSLRHDEALEMADKAIELDPLNPLSLEIRAFALYRARRYPEAIAEAHRALEISPGRQQARRTLANALLWSNRNEEAAAEYGRLDPTDYRRLVGEAVLAIRAGDRGRAMAHLETMRQRYGDATLYQYAEIYAQLGDADRAFDALHAALKVRDPGLAGIRVDRFLDPIRRDPRYVELERNLNFPS